MAWKKIKLGDALINRQERYKPNDINISNLKRIDKINFSGQIFLSDKGSNTDMIIIKKGDLVISGINVEKGAIAVYEGEEDITATIHYSSYIFNTEIIDIDFLKIFLRSPDFILLLKEQVPGGIKTEIKPKHIMPLEVYFPDTLKEQQYIASNFFEKEKMVIQLKQNLNIQLNQIEKLNQSILQEAFQGKLVEQSNEEINEAKLINDIQIDKNNLIKERKYKPLIASERADIKDLCFNIPKQWKWFRLGDVAFFQEGPGIRVWQFTKSGIKLLNVQNILKDDSVDYLNSDKYVSINEFNEKYKHFQIFDGDIVWASSGASWGKIAWHKDPGFPIMLNTSTVRLKFFSEKLYDPYLFYFLKSDFFKVQMMLQLMGMQPNFGATHLSRTYIPIPTLEEQKRIVFEIQKQLEKTKFLKTHIIASQKASEKLLDALLHKAFEVKDN